MTPVPRCNECSLPEPAFVHAGLFLEITIGGGVFNVSQRPTFSYKQSIKFLPVESTCGECSSVCINTIGGTDDFLTADMCRKAIASLDAAVPANARSIETNLVGLRCIDSFNTNFRLTNDE